MSLCDDMYGLGLCWWLNGKTIHLPVQEIWVQSLGQQDPLEKEMATHSSILAWEIPWTGEPMGYSPQGKSGTRLSNSITTYMA